MNIEAEAKKLFSVGRKVDGQIKHAFDIRRSEGGGIKLSHSNLTDMEYRRLLSHFGSPQTSRMGGEKDGLFYTEIVTEQPGTPLHFLFAVELLPEPFWELG